MITDKYIQLTLGNGDPILINVSKIDYITKQEKIHKGAIIMIGEYPAKVRETYECVHDRLGEWLDIL